MSAVLARWVMGTGLSGDVYWHLAAGQWMLAHHAVLREDLFSYTVRGRPWFDDEWGFQLMLAWLVRAVGPIALWLVPAGACIGALAASVARWRKAGAGWLGIAVATVIAGGCLIPGDTPRPQTVSYLLFACELLILALARRSAGWLLALPPLFVLWANSHGSFLAGLAVLALESLLARWPVQRPRVRTTEPLPRRATAGAFAASLVATLVNPHGPALLAYAYHVSTAPALTSLIQEWQSPNFHSVALVVLVLLPAAVVVGRLALSDTVVDAFDLVLWGAFFLASLHAQRFIPYLGLTSGGLVAGTPSLRRDGVGRSWATAPLAVVVAGGLLLGPSVPPGAPARGGVSGMPVVAARWLSTRTGRVFSTYWWNDYLIHLGVPVFVDGRTDLYFGTGVLEQWSRIAALRVDPDAALARWNVRYVLWPSATPLAVYLSRDPRWRVVLRSDGALVFEHR